MDGAWGADFYVLMHDNASEGLLPSSNWFYGMLAESDRADCGCFGEASYLTPSIAGKRSVPTFNIQHVITLDGNVKVYTSIVLAPLTTGSPPGKDRLCQHKECSLVAAAPG